MRILALDVGTKTIGVAVSDELQISSSGVKTIQRKSRKSDLNELEQIIDEYKPVEIVVGLPYREDGSLSQRGKDIEEFSKKVGNRFKLPVIYTDESFSTVFDASSKVFPASINSAPASTIFRFLAGLLFSGTTTTA